MQLRIHHHAHGLGHIFGRKRRTIRETQAGPDLKRDALPVFVDLPRGRQLGLHFLRRPVYPDQHAARKIADDFRRIVLH